MATHNQNDDAPRLVMPDRSETVALMKIDRGTWAAQTYAKFDRASVMRIVRAVAEVA